MSKTTITEFMNKPGKGYEIMTSEECINVLENNWKNYFPKVECKTKGDIARAIIEMHDLATETWQHNIVDCMMAMYNRLYINNSEDETIDIKSLVDELNEKVVVKRANAKSAYKEEFGKAKKFPLSQERYYEGQMYILQEIKNRLS